jgi:hypothetical protein
LPAAALFPPEPVPYPAAAAAATDDLVNILLCYIACWLTEVKLDEEAAVDGVPLTKN